MYALLGDVYHVAADESKYGSGWYNVPPAFGDAYREAATGLSCGNSSEPYWKKKTKKNYFSKTRAVTVEFIFISSILFNFFF